MQRKFRFLIPLILFVVSSTFASIKFYVAGTAELEAGVGKGSDSAYYRIAAYEAMMNGDVATDTSWIDSIYESGPNVFANKMPNPMQWKFDNYIVLGTADTFIIPENGEYTFMVKADEAMFIMIDDSLLSNNFDSVFMYPTIDEALDPSKGTDGVPVASDYMATMELTAGVHTLSFFFYEKSGTSKAELWWKTPSAPDTAVVVPAEAFGTRKDFCAFEIEWIDPDCAPGDDDVPTPLTLPFQYPPKICTEPADTIYYHYDFYEQNGTPDGVDIITTETVYETTFVTCLEQEVVEYIVWAETNDGRKSQDYAGSCNVIYVYGPDTAECGSDAIKWGIKAEASLQLQKDVKSSIFNMKGQKLNNKVLLNAKTLPSSGQYLIKEEATDTKKARLRKEAAVK